MNPNPMFIDVFTALSIPNNELINYFTSNLKRQISFGMELIPVFIENTINLLG